MRNHGFFYYFCLMIEGSGSKSPKDIQMRILLLYCHLLLGYRYRTII